MLKIIDHFRAREKAQDAKDRGRQKWFVAAREQRRIKAERLEDQEYVLLDAMTAMVLADAAEVKTFQIKFDRYDEATFKALMENQQQLDAVRKRIGDMLARAHQLDDGRHVFKTQDGTQVFDEHGTELSAETIDPNAISNSAPTWEDFQTEIAHECALMKERNDIHDFQEKLDHAREPATAYG